MYVALGLYYYNIAQDLTMSKEVILIFCTFAFIIDHFLIFHFEKQSILLFLILIDFLSASIVGFTFFETSNIYIIYFNIIAVTLFFVTENKKIIWTFLSMFFLVWFSIQIVSGVKGLALDKLGDIMNVCFVLFGCIVGYLIHKLMLAREMVAKQYEELNESHQALKEAHQQLSVYANQVEDLTSTKERNRIAREIHDTVGHRMTTLIIQLQLAKELMKQNKQEVEKTIETCEKIARDALQEIRMSVHTLRKEENISIDFQGMMQQLLREFSEMTHVQTAFGIEGDQMLITPSILPTIKRIVQESLTNAVRHGNATHCSIHIDCKKDKIVCTIRDNGKGDAVVTPGFGLVNMRERMAAHGGKLRFESEPDQGFTITAEFPLKKQQWEYGGVSL
ncbi:MAG: sensor histidine kinase [Tuberibacillus sp.]